MHEPIFVLETASAHLRELLRASCAPLAASAVFASARAAQTALDAGAPAVFVIGGTPLDEAALAVLRHAIQRRIPTLACVDESERGRALQLGVLEVCARSSQGIEELARRVSELLADNQRSLPPLSAAGGTSLRASAPLTLSSSAPLRLGSCRLIAIGASTGGPDAIAYLLSRLPNTLPGIVIVQHMPGTQTGAFAERLDEDTGWRVREARDGDRVERGQALIAPGGQHLRLAFGGAEVGVSQGGPAMAHVPSVDVLFDSVARELQRHALGILLTGMGDDGARGLLAMRQAGAYTMIQSAATCAVYGMPRRAAELGAALETVGLMDLPERVAAHCFGSAELPAGTGRPGSRDRAGR
jgi:two-component system, chemotaxis family, protein-glutamate methylesterase/glutaminase